MIIVRSDGAELVDDLKPSHDIKSDSDLLLSGSLQQMGKRE